MRKFILFLLVFFIGGFVYGADFSVCKLNNGQTVVINEVRTNPIVAIDTWVKTGSINETDKNNGISHFLEHLFFKGTKKHPYGEFDRILEAKGAVNNAATSKDFTHYYIEIPSEYFNLALEMHADMLQNPEIPESELEKERKVVLEEISKDINNPQNIVYNNLVEMMYINHPYKRRVIGKSEVIQNISREEILDYFNTYYSPSNMITIISGDVDSEKAIKDIKKEFSQKYQKTPKHTYKAEKPLSSYLKKEAYKQTQTGYMLVGFRGVKILDKDSYALDVLAAVLGEGKSSVLYQNLKEKRQLAFSISASNSTAKDDGIFYISANFAPIKYEELENSIFSLISKLQKSGITEEQVSLAKNMIENDTYYARESALNVAEEIGYTYVTTGNTDYYKNYLNNIKKVSTSDVNRVLKKYLGQNKAAESVVLPEEFKEHKVSDKTLPEPKFDLISENKGTKKYTAQNGMTLLYSPNTANDIIAISIIAKGGEFLEKIPGTAKLTAALMTKDTKNYNSEELAKEMEDNGIKINANSAADEYIITALTTKKEIDKTLDLLNEIINYSLFQENELEKIKTDMILSIKKARDIPLKSAIEGYNTLIYQGSVYSNSGKILEKTIPTIKREDILEYYSKIFSPNNLIVSINGNINSEDVFSKLGKIFNRTNHESFKYDKYKIPQITKPKVIEQIDKNTQTDWIFLGWQTSGVTNEKENAALAVMNSLMGGGMSSRLFVNLREREGLAYQLGSSFNPHMLKGSFVTYIGTNPNNYDRALKMLFNEIERLKKEYVGSEELQNAKTKLLGQYVLTQETNMEKALTVGVYEASGQGYDCIDRYKELVNSISETDILNIANKYFNQNYVLSVVKNK